MRRFVLLLAVPVALVSAAAATVIAWRRNPRMGTQFVNAVVNPGLVRRGLAGRGRSEIGTLEHVGRRSGIRRLTPVHPEPTADGFRIIVPLGDHSQWATNVLAAGHCRLQLHDRVYDLDEPALIPVEEIADLPSIARRVMTALGFEYLTLRTFAMNPGALEPVEEGAAPVGPIESESTAASPPTEAFEKTSAADDAAAAVEPEPVEVEAVRATTAPPTELLESEQDEGSTESSATSSD